jgi:hypothetical protein
MQLDWISKLYHFFSGKQNAETVVEETTGDTHGCPYLMGRAMTMNTPRIVQLKPGDEIIEVTDQIAPKNSCTALAVIAQPPEPPSPFPEFDKAYQAFNPISDVFVIAGEYAERLTGDYTEKVKVIGNKVVVFPKGLMVANNVAVVKTGYASGWWSAK